MIRLLKYPLLIIFLLSVGVAFSQSKKNRLQPGKMYDPGAKIYAPRYGFESIVPEGWKGTLPRDMEIFLLMPDSTNFGGEVFTFANDKKDLESIRKGWLEGTKLSENISIKASNINIQGDMITTDVLPDGQSVNTGQKGFAAARCSPFGPCITCIGIGPIQFYDQIRTGVESFVSKATFSEPSNVSIYVDFNWKEFLSNKMLITLTGVETGDASGVKESTFNLCADGSFKANIKKKGMMKQMNPAFKGRQAGKWSTESVGDTGVLKLTFIDLPEVEVPMRIKDEQIFINDERYFAAESEECAGKN